MRTILVVEDDINTLNGLKKLLEIEGYRVIAATTGEAAIQRANEATIDLLICDFCLPDMNGDRVCEQVRKLQPQCRLFLVTAYGLPEIVEKANTLDIESIFHKPIDLELLLSTIAAGEPEPKDTSTTLTTVEIR